MSEYQVMPNLSTEEFKSLKSDIANRGLQVLVEYDEDGIVLDSHRRIKACQELDIDTWPKTGSFRIKLPFK